MNDDLAAQLLAAVMGWSSSDYAQHGSQLQRLARYKYDGYEGYRPGERFLEHLAAWLVQLDERDRSVALNLVLRDLMFVSRAEIDHLIDGVYLDIIRPSLFEAAGAQLGQPKYLVSTIRGSVEFRDLRRKTLFLGLADGARLDRLRRSSPELSNEQFYPGPQPTDEAENRIIDALRKAIGRQHLREPALFKRVVLVDDFAGSGYTSLRKDESTNWTGRLWRAHNWVDSKRGTALEPDVVVMVLFYLATQTAVNTLRERFGQAGLDWDMRVGLTIEERLAVGDAATVDMLQRYFSSAGADSHLAQGGSDLALGFGGTGLPLVLHHNTPNNSLRLLWESPESGEGFVGLFPRHQRHSDDRP